MEEPKKEFIQGIADLFEDYEEAYVPGEWEAFSQQQQKKKYPFAPLWIKIAATLILIGAVIMYQLNDPAQPAKKAEVAEMKSEPAVEGSAAAGKAAPAIVQNSKEALAQTQSAEPASGVKPAAADGLRFGNVNPIDNRVAAAPEMASAQLPSAGSAQLLSAMNMQVPSAVTMQSPGMHHNTIKDSFGVVKADQYVANTVTVTVTAPENQLLPDHQGQNKKEADSAGKMSTMDFMLAESRHPVKSKQKKDAGSKWDFGVAVAPSMTSSNVNIAGGLTTAYRLSNKFSVSSGVSLMQLESGSTTAPQPMAKASISSLSHKELLAVDANIKAIDIPIGIVYQVNKHIYTSAGVSYFNVVGEKRSNTYGLTSQSTEAFSNPQTGFVSERTVLNSVAVEEPVAETPLKGNSYLGFFNFSIGRKQQLFNKYNVLIEPFIKVPIGKLSTQELNLMNSGLKFQISF